MKQSISRISMIAAGLALVLTAGCSTYDKGPYQAQATKGPALEGREPVVLMDPGVQHSLTYTGIQEQPLQDGRLKVTVHFRNRENRRIEVQAGCVFKDANGFSTGDESPWQPVILTENSTEDVTFTSASPARKYTIRVRQAR